MNETKIFSDDPRLTAYALGELETEECAQMEAAVAADPTLQAAVDEIRATAGRLTAALEAEPMPAPVPAMHVGSYRTVRSARIFRFPYWAMAGLAAAACLTLILTLREIPVAEKVQQQKADIAIKGTMEAKKLEGGPVATAQQPEGQVEIQFPQVKSVGGDRPGAAALLTEADEHVGVVVPKLPAAAESVADASLGSGGAMKEVWASAAAPAPASPAEEEVIKLSPFAVTADANQGADSRATNTLAGSRAKPNSSDLGYDARALVLGLVDETGATYRRAAGGARAFNTEAYDYIEDNGFVAVVQNPLSTFSVDVDTASYSNVRRFLLGGRRPPRDAVRIEELVNYFTYGYPAPAAADPAPFAATLEAASAPWAPSHRLVRIGLKSRELSTAARPAANLVFLVDVSGSMNEPNKLPLVKESLRILVGQLKPEDHVAIVTYAGSSGLALASTPVSHRGEIVDALDRLEAGGTTNGAMGIQLAYDVAKANFAPGGINRVILATDGDFNMGVTDRGDLVRLIQEKAKSGVFLTALGFGMGNYKDATLEQLADKGNGVHAYIDSPREARKVLAEQVNGTLATVAKDVKVQVEFNPARVQAYRLIGYENRLLKQEDFNNDKIDAGDIGAGHTVTALYEVVPTGVEWKPESTVDALKYQKPVESSLASDKPTGGRPLAGDKPRPRTLPASDELLTVKIRYKAPDGDTSRLLEFPLTDQGAAFAAASADFKFAAAVAGFGMVLRDSPHKGTATLTDVARWAAEGTGTDAGGYRGEFLSLIKQAETILPSQG